MCLPLCAATGVPQAARTADPVWPDGTGPAVTTCTVSAVVHQHLTAVPGPRLGGMWMLQQDFSEAGTEPESKAEGDLVDVSPDQEANVAFNGGRIEGSLGVLSQDAIKKGAEKALLGLDITN
ncbi:hypothetical protein NDU88_002882 [Pleurodeles waltl]|uniref:Uncharacterized protein n=1 Tax=Pleurodeles waltl TaxID=8319 RepID=A0AAV7T4J0_PLEWA|nr:hypothetical protein NDU88_002882 [Pleurodeles waltl]